jgi:hypothetical protein
MHKWPFEVVLVPLPSCAVATLCVNTIEFVNLCVDAKLYEFTSEVVEALRQEPPEHQQHQAT